MGKSRKEAEAQQDGRSGSETRVVEPGGAVITCLEGLMEAEDCETPDELVELLDSQVDGGAWIDWQDSDDTRLTVVVGQYGLELDYPFTMGELWVSLLYLSGLGLDGDSDDDSDHDTDDV